VLSSVANLQATSYDAFLRMAGKINKVDMLRSAPIGRSALHWKEPSARMYMRVVVVVLSACLSVCLSVCHTL